MPSPNLKSQLESIVASGDFPGSSSELTSSWAKNGVGVDSVDAILDFMESHPGLDYGMPGPLVHFAERFYGQGYEKKLLESIKRRPTMVTVWMLNRVINGIDDPMERGSFVAAMQSVLSCSKVERNVTELAREFLNPELE